MRQQPSLAEALGGRWAVSMRVWLIISAITLATSLVWSSERMPTTVFAQVIVGIAGDLAMGLVLLAADRTYLRERRARPAPLAIVIGTWALSNVARLAARAALLELVGGGVVEAEPRVWAVSTIEVVLWIGLLTYYFAIRESLGGMARALDGAAESLKSAADRDVIEAVLLRDALAAGIDETISPAIRLLEREIDTLGDDPSQAELRELADETMVSAHSIVRDVSHRISVSGPAVQEASMGAGPAAELPSAGGIVDFSMGFRAFVMSIVFASSTMALLQTVVVHSTLRLTDPIDGLVCWAICLFVLLVGSVALHARGRLLGLTFVLLPNVLAVAAGVAWMRFSLGDRFFDARILPVVVLWGVAFVAGVVSTSMELSLARLRDLGRENARLAAAEVQRSIDVDQAAEVLRRQVSETLHGPVQGRLAAVALALRLHAAARDAGDPVDVQATVRRCKALLEEASRDMEAIARGALDSGLGLEDRLGVLVERWAGLIEVRITIGPRARAALEASRIDSDRLFGLVEETTNNSCSHGRARELDISVHLVGDDRGLWAYEVIAADDGVGPGEEVRPGLGLSAVSRIGGTWAMERGAAGGCRLRLEIPLSDSQAKLDREISGVRVP